MTRLNSYLNFAGSAEEAFELYRSVFGGEFSSVVRFRDLPMEGVEITEEEKDRIMHIALPIGDNLLMGSDVVPSLGLEVVEGNNAYVSVHPESREEADRIFSALSQGGEVEMPIGDQAWGDYFGSFADRFGIRWMVNYAPPREG